MTINIRNRRQLEVVLCGVGVLCWMVLGMPLKAQESHDGHDHAVHAAESEHADHADAHSQTQSLHEEGDADHAEHEHTDVHEEAGAHDDHDGHIDADYDDHGHEDAHSDAELHGEEGGHGEHAEEASVVHLTDEQRKRFEIVVQYVGPGKLKNEIRLPGEIVFNQDRVVHVVPRVSGIVSDVFKSMGDAVKAGELLAVIESRELADAKSAYLAAKARMALAEKTFAREKTLREQDVSSEQEFLEAEQARAESLIECRSTEQKLHALGLPKSEIKDLDPSHDAVITRYEIRSPIDGTVTERHISRGESLEADADIFTVVDLSSVWVDLTVYTKNMGMVRPHQDITLKVDHSGIQARAKVAMVTPFADSATRSATARVRLDNHDGEWTPGTFVTGFISTTVESLPVVVPRQAVQNIEGRDVVFVAHGAAYEMQPITIGRSDRTHVEVVAGLEPGMTVVTAGAFQLKATVITSTLDSHAGHGH